MNSNKVAFVPRLLSAWVMIVLIIAHVVPIPIFETLILYVIVTRPRWFKRVVDLIYSREDIDRSDHGA